MPSASVYDIYCARYNGQWASKVRVDLDPNDGHKTGWDRSSASDNIFLNDTQYNGGYAGNRQIWDNNEAVFYALEGPRFGTASGSYDTGSYPFYRYWDGSFYIKHGGWSNRNGQALGLPLPTYTLSMSGNNGWRSSGGSEPGSAVVNKDLSWTHTYKSWDNNIVRDPIVVYKKPYIPDQTMTITSLTTPHQYAPGNTTGSVLLKQYPIYASIDLTSVGSGTTVPSNEAVMGYSTGQTIWNDNIWTTQKFVKILAYTSHWDSINDIEFSWNVTGAGAGGFSAQSGLINNFQPVTASGWTDYAYGYQAIDIAITTIDEKSTDINIVANGLQFNSGIQSRNYKIR